MSAVGVTAVVLPGGAAAAIAALAVGGFVTGQVVAISASRYHVPDKPKSADWLQELEPRDFKGQQERTRHLERKAHLTMRRAPVHRRKALKSIPEPQTAARDARTSGANCAAAALEDRRPPDRGAPGAEALPRVPRLGRGLRPFLERLPDLYQTHHHPATRERLLEVSRDITVKLGRSLIQLLAIQDPIRKGAEMRVAQIVGKRQIHSEGCDRDHLPYGTRVVGNVADRDAPHHPM